jgi:hypothetical protein
VSAGSRAAATLGWAALATLGLLAVGGAASRPSGLALGLPSGWKAALVGAALLLVARLVLDRERTAAVAAGLIFLPVLLVCWPGAPGIRALSGPPLVVPVLAALILLLPGRPPRWANAAFLPAVLVVYSLGAGRVQLQVGAEGDEPHYLMVAESLLRDGDLALEQDYAEGRYRAFYWTHDELAPHFRVRGREGRIYSLHALGLSLLVLPAYALGGYPAVSFFMALLAALLAREVRELVRAASGDHALAEGVGWAVAFSPPLAHYAGLVFTEVPAALAVAIVLRRGLEPERPGLPRTLLTAAALAALPWLNVRYAALAAILLVYLLAARAWRPRVAALTAAAAASAAGLALYHWALYGFFDPRRVYGVRREFSLAVLPEGLPGLLLDQEFGLLCYAPVYALAAAGLVALLRGSRRLGLATLALMAAVLLTAGAWPMWRGGFNPPGRFLVPLVPALALALGFRLRAGLGAGAALLLGWSVAVGMAGVAEPRLVHRDRDGTAPLFRELSGAEEWTRLLPAYVLAEADRGRLAAVWAAALALVALAWRRPSQGPVSLAFATAGWLVAAGAASRVSDGRTGGRDAVRLIGRPALVFPGATWEPVARAEWTPADLGWGPLYEPHRHPDGAPVGSRLALPPGFYLLKVETGDLPAGETSPVLELRVEGSSMARTSDLTQEPGGFKGSFVVRSGERRIELRLRGGSPLILRRVTLAPLDFGVHEERRARGEDR